MPATTQSDHPLDSKRLADAAARATIRGSLLFHLDLAATLAQEAATDLDVGGWAIEVGARGYEVLLLDSSLDRELALVTFAADGTPLVATRTGSSAPAARAAGLGRRTLAAAFGDSGAKLVLPPLSNTDADATLEAYWLRFADDIDSVATYGHCRALLSPDGRTIVSSAGLPCSDTARADALIGAPLLSTVADQETPNEVHVYLSLKHGIEIEVITSRNGSRWSVERGMIQFGGLH